MSERKKERRNVVGKVPCDQCDQLFMTEQTLRGHKAFKHPEGGSVAPTKNRAPAAAPKSQTKEADDWGFL